MTRASRIAMAIMPTRHPSPPSRSIRAFAAHHHRRQPAQARVAGAAERAVGAVAARGRASRRRQARRGAPGAARPGAAGHRHRLRRRADAAAFRDHVHRRPRRRRFREQEDGAHPQSLRRRRADGRRPGRTPRPGLRRGREVPALADGQAAEIHAARPDDDGRHALRRATTRAAKSWRASSRPFSTRRRARSPRRAST